MGALEDYNLDVSVLEYLQKAGSATRAELGLMCGGTDRAIRKSINRLRALKYPIGMQGRKGYSYNERTDVNRAINFYRKKAFSELKIAAALAGIDLEGQMTMEEVFGDVLV